LAKGFGILRGLDLGLTMDQQKAFRLIPPFSFLSDESLIGDGLGMLERDFDFDYVSAELGVTEIFGASYDRSLKQIEIARTELEAHGKRLFVKAHVASDEHDEKYGNFNFLAQYAKPTVGIEPHTVMFFSLTDPDAPAYGNANFKFMADFMNGEAKVRPTWYFPETSYWCGLDIDFPLFLTDFLRARAEDFDTASRMGVNGTVDFTSGQEAGYWLMDWTFALMNDAEIGSDPWAGATLLGEDRAVWEKIGEFQTRFMKGRRMLSILSAPNLVEELPPPFYSSVLERHTPLQLKHDPEALSGEISVLSDALAELPDLSGVRNPELRAMLEITHARIRHAYWVRVALQDRLHRASDLEQAQAVRLAALAEMQDVVAKFDRYPETSIYEWGENPTSYHFGYLWTAKTLHYWQREEDEVRQDEYSPFFENIVDPWSFLF
jgi:hypothetical protein